MKKLVIFLLSALLLISCDVDALKYYNEATLKTETVEDGQSKLDIKVEMNFSEEAKDSVEELALFEEINFSHHMQFGKDQTISRQYLGTNAVGVDTVYYREQDLSYIRVPFLGKYLKLNDLSFGGIESSTYEEPPISEASKLKIAEKWRLLVQEDDVVNLGDEVIDTPEGEVKVKKFVISFSHDQVYKFLNEVIDILAEDDVFIEQVKSYPTYTFENNELKTSDYELSAEDIIQGNRALLDAIVIEDFSMTAYIDIDQYIVNHIYDAKISFKDILEEAIESITIHAEYELFDLNNKQEMDFPNVTENDWITFDEVIDSFGDFSIE